MRRRTVGILAGALVTAASCSGIPMRESADAARELSGYWAGSIYVENVNDSVLRTVFEMRVSPGGQFQLFSKPHGIRRVRGWWSEIFARFWLRGYPRGSLISVEGGVTPSTDGVALSGTMAVPFFEARSITGSMHDGLLQIESAPGSGGRIAITAERANESAFLEPVDDYRSLGTDLARIVDEQFYSPVLLSQRPQEQVLDQLPADIGKAHDDIEAMFIFFLAANRIGASHLFLSRPQAGNRVEQPTVEYRKVNACVAYARFSHFDGAKQAARSLFGGLQEERISTLIFDLRGNPGGDLSAASIVTHLIREPMAAGHFVGRNWWRHHTTPPEPAMLPILTSDDIAAFRQLMDREGGARGIVKPANPYFGGNVLVLVDDSTRSAAEMLAASLKQVEHVTLIGETTAGEMLASEQVLVGDGWALTIPTAVYVAEHAGILEGRGVAPDVESEPGDKAVFALLEELGHLNCRDEPPARVACGAAPQTGGACAGQD